MQVIIMCKAPVAGQVKTRLMTRYSAEQAANIHAKMARIVIARANSLFDAVTVSSNDPSHAFFKEFNLPVMSQGEGDLGQRMTRLMQHSFKNNHDSILFLGTDSPHMSESRLLEAQQKLQDYDVVIGPVEDGGYDLICMSKSYPQLFQSIEWSSEKVTSQTINIARQSDLNCFKLEKSFDIDTPEDLQRIEAALPELFQL